MFFFPLKKICPFFPFCWYSKECFPYFFPHTKKDVDFNNIFFWIIGKVILCGNFFLWYHYFFWLSSCIFFVLVKLIYDKK